MVVKTNNMTEMLPAGIVERLHRIIKKKGNTVQYGPIGVDFGLHGVHMVQFKKMGDTLAVHASVHVLITDEQRASSSQLRAFIKKSFIENGFVGRDVVTCMRPKDVKIMMLNYMRQAGKADEELIIKRIAERIDDVDNYVIDYIMVRPAVVDSQERSVFVALAHRDKVICHLEHLRKAGLVVKVLEIESTAVRRLISAKHDSEHSANLMIISIGDTQTYITVLSGRRLIYERDINFGEQQLIATLCKELDIDEHEARTMLVRGNASYTESSDGENQSPVAYALFSVLKPHFMALVEDINRALIYAASETRGLPVKQVYLTNRVATWHGIESFINTLIEVPVGVLTSFEDFNNAALFSDNSGPRGAVVTGMALHGLTEFN